MLLSNVLRATTMYTFSTSQLPKVVRDRCALTFVAFKRASRNNDVHFFDIATAKSGPRPVCFDICCFQTCFAPQGRAIFKHLNFKKVVREWCVLTLFTSKCASRHNGVHFLDISTSKSAPKLRCFVHFDFHMCFAPQRRALFPQRHFQKCSETDVFCHF